MSDNDREEILAELRVIRRLIKGVGGAVGAGILAIALVGISDHFDQKVLRSDNDWMKPRVQALWYRFNPSAVDETAKTQDESTIVL